MEGEHKKLISVAGQDNNSLRLIIAISFCLVISLSLAFFVISYLNVSSRSQSRDREFQITRISEDTTEALQQARSMWLTVNQAQQNPDGPDRTPTYMSLHRVVRQEVDKISTEMRRINLDPIAINSVKEKLQNLDHLSLQILASPSEVQSEISEQFESTSAECFQSFSTELNFIHDEISKTRSAPIARIPLSYLFYSSIFFDLIVLAGTGCFALKLPSGKVKLASVAILLVALIAQCVIYPTLYPQLNNFSQDSAQFNEKSSVLIETQNLVSQFASWNRSMVINLKARNIDNLEQSLGSFEEQRTKAEWILNQVETSSAIAAEFRKIIARQKAVTKVIKHVSKNRSSMGMPALMSIFQKAFQRVTEIDFSLFRILKEENSSIEKTFETAKRSSSDLIEALELAAAANLLLLAVGGTLLFRFSKGQIGVMPPLKVQELDAR